MMKNGSIVRRSTLVQTHAHISIDLPIKMNFMLLYATEYFKVKVNLPYHKNLKWYFLYTSEVCLQIYDGQLPICRLLKPDYVFC